MTVLRIAPDLIAICPGGTHESSPAFQRRVCRHAAEPRPGARL